MLPEYEYESANIDRPSLTLGDENHTISTGGMTRPEFDRVWSGGGSYNHYRVVVTTPFHDGQHLINAGGGDDLITGSSGSDVIDGGDGFDILSFDFEGFPLYSNFAYEGDFPRYFVTINTQTGSASWEGRDIVIEHSERVTDADQKPIGYEEYNFPIAGWSSFNTRFSNVEAFRGTEGNDIMTGHDAPLQVFDLSAGGTDTLDGGEGTDWVTFGKAGFIKDQEDPWFLVVDLTKGTAVSQKFDYITNDLTNVTSRISNVENVMGTNGDDYIIGDGGDNVIHGGGGSDSLDGGNGVDTLLLEAGFAGDAAFFIEDTYELINRDNTDHDETAGKTVDMAAGLLNHETSGSTLFVNFENVIGTSRNDMITGDDGNNRLEGWDGDDILIGGDGRDFLHGGNGNNTLTGGDGKDTFAVDVMADGQMVITDFAFGTDTIAFV